MSSATRPRRGPRVNYAGQAPLSQSEEDFEESPAQSEESDEEVDSGKLSEELGDDMDLDESGEFGEAGEEMDGEAVEVGQSHRVADGDFAIDQSSKPSAKGSKLHPPSMLYNR